VTVRGGEPAELGRQVARAVHARLAG
jgi:hypothetical protein